MLENSGVYRFCKDDISKIENYEQAINDKENVWCCHHRLELTLDGDYAHSKEDLIRMGMYYNRPYFELIFMKDNEHSSLHRKAEAKAGKKLFGGPRKEKHSLEERRSQSIGHLDGISKLFYEKFNKLPFEASKLYHEEKYAYKHFGCFRDEIPENKIKEYKKKIFGREYVKHYGYSTRTNRRQYRIEMKFFENNGFYSWEKPNEG